MPSSQLFNNPSRSLRIAAWAAVMLCLHAPLQASSTSTSTPKHAAKAAPISVIGPVTRSVGTGETDRKSTRLNSSHGYISYAVFCLKKKNTRQISSQAVLTVQQYGSDDV